MLDCKDLIRLIKNPRSDLQLSVPDLLLLCSLLACFLSLYFTISCWFVMVALHMVVSYGIVARHIIVYACVYFNMLVIFRK